MDSRGKRALVLFSRTPELVRRVPDEPYAGLPWTDLDSLFFSILDDVIETATSLDSTDIYLLKFEQDFSNDFLNRFGGKVQVIELPNTLNGQEINFAFETLFSKKYEHIVLLLEPHPLLTKYDLKAVFDLLQYDDDCVVIAQYPEGKYFLIGLKSDHSDLFEIAEKEDGSSTGAHYLQRICSQELMVFPMFPKYSLDNGTNLLRLKTELEEIAGGNGFCHRTRTMFKIIDKKYKIRRTR